MQFPGQNTRPKREKKHCWDGWQNVNEVCGLPGHVLSMLIFSLAELSVVTVAEYSSLGEV